MTAETTTDEMLVAIREKLKSNIEGDSNLSDIAKVYAGTPKSIPNYPCVLLDYDEEDITQAHKGQTNIGEKIRMNVVVMDKYLDYKERQDKLLILTGLLKKNLNTNRYLNGLHAESNAWKVIDVKVLNVRFEALVNPKTFVLDSSEIRIEITTEGI